MKEIRTMPVPLPAPRWPTELVEDGPPEDPSILLSAPATIGQARHLVLAVRINPRTLAADYRADLNEDVYADSEVEELLDELTFLDDIDQSVLVPLSSGLYVIWMVPFADTVEA
jgi:hypothetical protein